MQEKKETVQDIAGDKADAKKGIQPEPKDKISMVSVSSSCIRYSDGVVIKKGDEYQGAKIVKITKNCVDLVYAGKPFKCDPLGLRR